MTHGSKTYVLVHGAWHGGWCWRDVSEGLRARGHVVHTPTLTGLAERKNLLTPEVGLQTHVDDIVALFETEDLSDVHLVGWSYGGVVITGVLARVHARVRAATFLDAFVLEDGESVSDRLSERLRRGVIAMEQQGLSLAPPDPAEAWGVCLR